MAYNQQVGGWSPSAPTKRSGPRESRARPRWTRNLACADPCRTVRESGLLRLEDADHEQPRRGDHVASVGDDGYPCNVQAGQVSEEEESRSDHLSHVDKASA